MFPQAKQKLTTNKDTAKDWVGIEIGLLAELREILSIQFISTRGGGWMILCNYPMKGTKLAVLVVTSESRVPS